MNLDVAEKIASSVMQQYNLVQTGWTFRFRTSPFRLL